MPEALEVEALMRDAARGTIPFRGAALPQALAPATSGHHLETRGAGADPVLTDSFSAPKKFDRPANIATVGDICWEVPPWDDDPALGAFRMVYAQTRFDANEPRDPVLGIGYNLSANANRDLEGEAALGIFLEGSYNNGGAHFCEMQLRYYKRDGTQVRPMEWRINKDVDSDVLFHLWTYTLRLQDSAAAGEQYYFTLSPDGLEFTHRLDYGSGRSLSLLGDGTNYTLAASGAPLVLSGTNITVPGRLVIADPISAFVGLVVQDDDGLIIKNAGGSDVYSFSSGYANQSVRQYWMLTPPATALNGIVNAGTGGWGGGAGAFAGSADGSIFAGNGPSGFAGNLLDLQTAGVSRFRVTGAGSVVTPNLPTSDPAVAGAWWRSGNDLKISTG
jgi:hypothetical protein